jgi:uncharacterized protein (DUF2252 family)
VISPPSLPDRRGLSVADRAERGKLARRTAPRSSHAEFTPSATRANPIEALERQAATRIPELVPVRYGRMLVSPFTFYRGAAMIMAADLASTPRSGLTVQCCGDAHLSNFGMFASPERTLVFDLNDFDETLPGPWEWDVKRLAASVLIAAINNGYEVADQERAVLGTVEAYRNATRQFATMNNLDIWYAHLNTDQTVQQFRSQVNRRMARRTEKALAKARTRDSVAAFSKLTYEVDGQVRIVDQSPLIIPISQIAELERDQLYDGLRRLLAGYRDTLEYHRRILLDQFELADVARKVVGVGSVGTRAWIALMVGRNGQDPLFLQIKEAEASVLEQFVGASEFSTHGERVVHGQRLMQAASDILLGWFRFEEGIDGRAHDYYVRQLKDWKGSAEIEQMAPDGLALYGRACGWTLARAHARSGDPIAIGAYLGAGPSFDRAILEFSGAYAEQNDRDYQALAAAVEDGRIAAELSV